MTRFLEGVGTPLSLAAVFAACLAWEQYRPLRRPTQPKARRVLRNLSIAALDVAVLRAAFYPWILKASSAAAERGWGLLSLGDPGPSVRIVLGFLALDYTLYVWHWMNHELPFLWRFHNVHHVDLDLDVSTASRFHLGELILSQGFRLGQIALLGVEPFTVLLYDGAVLAASQFHHANLRLPERLDRALSRVVVTPRMHGIHHSVVREETNSNFSTIFSFWDRIHRSLRLDVPAGAILIGVPSYRDARELTFFKSLWLPFRPQRPWRFPDGTAPRRDPPAGTRAP